jgi:PAS domain S-box-containing protein
MASSLPPIPIPSSARSDVEPRRWSAPSRRPSQHYASLVLDVYGSVLFCNRDVARLFGCDPGEVVGRQVKSFLIDLPFNESTPGYNLAVTIVWYSEGWRPVRVRTRDGAMIDVQARVLEFRSADRHQLLLELRWVALERRFAPTLRLEEQPGAGAST